MWILPIVLYAGIFCCAPIAIYRFGFKSGPVKRKKAIKISFVYSAVVVVFFILYYSNTITYIGYGITAYTLGYMFGSALPGILGGIINYYILTMGKTKRKKD